MMNTRISGGRSGFGFSTQGSARLSNCTVAGVQLGVSIVMNKPAEIVLEDNEISAKMLVSLLLFSLSVGWLLCCTVSGWPKTWNTQDFSEHGKLREFCATSAKNCNKQSIFSSSFKYLCRAAVDWVNRIIRNRDEVRVWW